MDDPMRRALLSRREVLKRSGGLLALAGLGPVLAACGGSGGSTTSAPAASSEAAATTTAGGSSTAAAVTAKDIKMWWWGEQEAVGIQKWMDDTLAKWKEQTGAKVDPLLRDTDQVIPQFTKAAAAGDVPDVQFLFNGIYHMENVWLDYLTPLDGLLSPDTIANGGGTTMSSFEGKSYRTGFYAIGFGIAYNKALFTKAGLDPEAPPTTWEAFTEACTKLKAAGIIPISGGVKDGFLGEWYLVNALTQNLNSAADAINLFIGELDWNDPKYHEHWSKLEEIKKNGWINDDATSLELYQGIELFDNGKSAMCFNTTPAIPNSQSKIGADNLGYIVMPTFGTGSMAGVPILDTQGFGIPTKAKDPQSAAAFIDFMHTPDRLQAMWTISKQVPADSRFDSSVIDVPLIKAVQEKWIAGPHNVYVADLMPTLFWTDAMFVASQKILGGSMTGTEAGKLAAEVTAKWKKQNPDKVSKYQTWGKDLSA